MCCSLVCVPAVVEEQEHDWRARSFNLRENGHEIASRPYCSLRKRCTGVHVKISSRELQAAEAPDFGAWRASLRAHTRPSLAGLASRTRGERGGQSFRNYLSRRMAQNCLVSLSKAQAKAHRRAKSKSLVWPGLRRAHEENEVDEVSKLPVVKNGTKLFGDPIESTDKGTQTRQKKS